MDTAVFSKAFVGGHSRMRCPLLRNMCAWNMYNTFYDVVFGGHAFATWKCQDLFFLHSKRNILNYQVFGG